MKTQQLSLFAEDWPQLRKLMPETYAARYRSYLYSAAWQMIRAEVIARALGRCEINAPGCRIEANQAHHWTYAPYSLGRDGPEFVVAACDNCHEYLHSHPGALLHLQPHANDNQKKKIEDAA
jgi:hypothetical protein